MNQFTKARIAAMASLFCNGVIYASWGVHIPTIKDKFNLSDAILSFAMLAVAFGGILVMAWGGRWIARVGSAHAAVRSGLLMALAGAGILLVPHYALLLAWLALFGAASGINDIAANSQGVLIEARYKRPIFGSLHGSFSLGGMVGAVVASGWRAMAWPAAWHLAVVCGFCALLTLLSKGWLIQESAHPPQAEAEPDPHQVKENPGLHRHLVSLGCLAFLGLIVEGAMYDWTAVYMRDVVQSAAAWIGAGYAAFSIGMATGRFSGDPVRAHLGPRTVILASCCLVLAGLGVTLFVPRPMTAIGGFFVAGLGLSNLIPIMFSSAGKAAMARGRPASAGLAVTTRLAYVGLLVGPVIVGFLAHQLSLRAALGLALVCICVVGLASLKVFNPNRA